MCFISGFEILVDIVGPLPIVSNLEKAFQSGLFLSKEFLPQLLRVNPSDELQHGNFFWGDLVEPAFPGFVQFSGLPLFNGLRFNLSALEVSVPPQP